MKQARKRLTYANVMSSLAVFLVLGGATAIAANQLAKNSVGSKQLKRNAVTTAKLKKNAVTTAKIKNNAVSEAKIQDKAVTGAKVKDGSLTGSDIDLAKLGTVPSANTANSANSAGVASSLAGLARKAVRVTAHPAGASEEETLAAAPEIPLYSSGPLSLYAKCINSGSGTSGYIFIRTSEDGVILDSDGDDLSGNPFLDVNTPEDDREILSESAGPNSSNYYANHSPEFGAWTPNGTVVQGHNQIAVKNGDLPGGNGVFGPGNVCLFGGDLLTIS